MLLLLGLGLITCVLLVVLFGGEDALAANAAPMRAGWRWLRRALFEALPCGHRWQRLLAMIGYRLGYLYTTGAAAGGLVRQRAAAGARRRLHAHRRAAPRRAPPYNGAGGGSRSIVLERALDILAIVALGALFGFAVLRNEGAGLAAGQLCHRPGDAAVLGVALLVAPPLLTWMRRWSGHRLWQSLVGFAEQLASSLRVLFRQPGAGLLVTGESLYIWLCDALVVWFVTLCARRNMPFSIAALVALTVDVLAAVAHAGRRARSMRPRGIFAPAGRPFNVELRCC